MKSTETYKCKCVGKYFVGNTQIDKSQVFLTWTQIKLVLIMIFVNYESVVSQRGNLAF